MVKRVASSVLLSLVAALACGIAAAADPHMMTKEQLLPMLGKPGVTVVDVRTKYDWDNSKEKIKGAVREEAMKVGSWINKYSGDKAVVLYCA